MSFIREAALKLQQVVLERYDGVYVRQMKADGSTIVDVTHQELNMAFTVRPLAWNDGCIYDIKHHKATAPVMRKTAAEVCDYIEDEFVYSAHVVNLLEQSCSKLKRATADERRLVVQAWMNKRTVHILQYPIPEMKGADKRWLESMKTATYMGTVGGFHAYYK